MVSAKASSPKLECRWYLADDVRAEQGGKVSLLGLYPDDLMFVEMPPEHPDPTPEAPIAIEGIAIYCALIGFQGASEFTLKLRDAKNPALGLTRRLVIESPTAHGVVNLVSKFRPIAIHDFGEKRFSIESEALKFKSQFVFRILRRDVGATLPQGHVSLKEAAPEASIAPARRQANVPAKKASRVKRS